MGRMKELFMEYQQQMTGSNAEFIDDEYHFQNWVEARKNIPDEYGWTEAMEEQYWKEQPPYPFATDVELEELNNRIRIKYSDMDIESVLHKVLGDANPLVDEIKNKLNDLNNIRNGYFD